MGVKEIKQVLQLQATIDKLESELEISAQEISKYQILWKNECRQLMQTDTAGEYHRHLGHLHHHTMFTVSHIIFIIFEMKLDLPGRCLQV